MDKVVFSFFVVFVLTSTKILGQSITMGGIFPTIDHSGSINNKVDYGLYYFVALPMFNFKNPSISTDAYFHLLYLEQSFTYKKSEKLSFTGSYLYQRSNVTTSNFVNENRIYIQSKYKHTFNKSRISHRFRFDGRFIQNRNTNTYPFTNRLRYQLGFEKQITDKAYVSGYEELFFSTTKNTIPIYNENWAYLGFGRKLSEQNNIELGVLYVTWNIGKNTWFNQYYLQFSWVNHMNFLK